MTLPLAVVRTAYLVRAQASSSTGSSLSVNRAGARRRAAGAASVCSALAEARDNDGEFDLLASFYSVRRLRERLRIGPRGAPGTGRPGGQIELVRDCLD